MRPLLYPPVRPESIGEVLDGGFRIFQSTLLRCLPYSVLAMIAGQLPNIRDLLTRQPLRQAGGRDAIWWAWYLLSLAISVILWSAVLLRQDSLARSQRRTTLAELGAACTRLPQLIVLLVLAGLVLALMAPLIYVGALYLAPGLLQAAWPGPLGLLRPPLWVSLGLVLAALGCYLTPGLMMAWPSLLLLRRGPLQSFLYGVRLVRGHWWRTTTALTILSVIVLVIDTLAGVAAALVFTLSGQGDVARAIALAGATVIIASVVGMPFTCALTLALFRDLRVRREGVDLERRIHATAATPS
jgi:hypothetical protein